MHSKPYLERLAAMYGFREESITQVVLRMDAGKPVAGYVVVLRLTQE